MKEYNIKSGVPTTVETTHSFKSYLFHPYGLSEFRKEVLNFISEKRDKGLYFHGYDNLTHAWRTPWDTHVRYHELMNPLNHYVTNVAKSLTPEFDWYHNDSWIAEYENCSAANLHAHGETLWWSYCYYVRVPDEGPGFMLKDGLSGDFVDLNISEGDILFFRSFIEHQVMPSLGNRVVIAGNVRILDTSYLQLQKNNSDLDTEDWTNSFT